MKPRWRPRPHVVQGARGDPGAGRSGLSAGLCRAVSAPSPRATSRAPRARPNTRSQVVRRRADPRAGRYRGPGQGDQAQRYAPGRDGHGTTAQQRRDGRRGQLTCFLRLAGGGGPGSTQARRSYPGDCQVSDGSKAALACFRGLLERGQRDWDAAVRGRSARLAIWASASSPNRSWNLVMPSGEELPGLGDLRSSVHGGERVAPPDPRTADHEGELPAVIGHHHNRDWVSHVVRSAARCARRPGPGPLPLPSSHQQARQTGSTPPSGVTSETMLYKASGERATTTDSKTHGTDAPSGRPCRPPPPPTHMVSSRYRPFRVQLAQAGGDPAAPMGWPREMPEPLTLSLSG